MASRSATREGPAVSEIAETRDIGATVMFLDGFTALAVAILLVGLWDLAARARSSLPSLPLFFAVLVLGAWAGGTWTVRLLAPGWALYWGPYLLAGLAFATLLSLAARTPAVRRSVEAASRGEHERAQRMTGVEIALTVILILLAVPIVIRYAV